MEPTEPNSPRRWPSLYKPQAFPMSFHSLETYFSHLCKFKRVVFSAKDRFILTKQGLISRKISATAKCQAFSMPSASATHVAAPHHSAPSWTSNSGVWWAVVVPVL